MLRPLSLDVGALFAKDSDVHIDGEMWFENNSAGGKGGEKLHNPFGTDKLSNPKLPVCTGSAVHAVRGNAFRRFRTCACVLIRPVMIN